MLRERRGAKFQAVGIEPIAQAAEITAPPWLEKGTAVSSSAEPTAEPFETYSTLGLNFKLPIYHRFITDSFPFQPHISQTATSRWLRKSGEKVNYSYYL